MAWLEQCEVCGGGGCGFFCCHRNSHPDLNQAAGGACPHQDEDPGLVQEFQFFGRPGSGVAWLMGDDAGAAGEGGSVDRTPRAPPVAPAGTVWDEDGRWPAFDGGWSISAPSSKSPLTESAVAGLATSPGAAVVPICCGGGGGGGADPSHADAMEGDKVSSPGKDDNSSSSISNNKDREARVLRYREKKKRRKFGKQIRYESRKAYAEARPRIRGRFVKAPDGLMMMMMMTTPQPPVPLPPQRYDAADHIDDMGWLRAFRRP